MTNKEAIEIITMAKMEAEWKYPEDYAAAFDKAIEALNKDSKLPSYFPGKGYKDE